MGGMNEVISSIQNVQRSIGRTNDPKRLGQTQSRLYFAEILGLLDISFYGLPWEEAFLQVMELLCTSPDVARSIRSLQFSGPDEGADGTKNWDFSSIIESDAVFPNLTSLHIEPTQPEHHNQSIIAQVYDENGMITRLIAKMPKIENLCVPSAPDASFFDFGELPLQRLRVDSGYNHQSFILNLSKSSRLSSLRILDFGDYNQRYMEDYEEQCTTFEHFVQLFESSAFSCVKFFILRNSILSRDQLSTLRSLRKELQFYMIQSYGCFVR
jgi:hypothetical protein